MECYTIMITEAACKLLQRNNCINPFSIIGEFKIRLANLERVVVRLEHTMDKLSVQYKPTANEIVFYESAANREYNNQGGGL